MGKKSESKKSNNLKCFNCQKLGHMARDCKTDTQKFCKICKKNNHFEKDCFFKNKKGNTTKEETPKVAFRTSVATDKWIIDSGSTSHMTNDLRKLKEAREIKIKVNVASKEGAMMAKKIGTVELGKCILNDVLYVCTRAKRKSHIGKCDR